MIDLEYMAMELARQISTEEERTVVEVRRGRQRMNGLTRSALRQICSSAVVAGIDEALTFSAPNASARRVLPLTRVAYEDPQNPPDISQGYS